MDKGLGHVNNCLKEAPIHMRLSNQVRRVQFSHILVTWRIVFAADIISVSFLLLNSL